MYFIDGRKYSPKEILEHIQNCEKPLVYVNACTHGNEKVGVKVIDALVQVSVIKGTLVINIANREASKKSVRFIEQDLNRVFPGNPNGGREEKLAFSLLPIIQLADVVIDIHSTESGVDSSVIVECLDKNVLSLIRSVCPRRVLIMEATKGNALISGAKTGIAFEYGKDNDEKTFKRTLRDVLIVLKEMKMIKVSVRRRRGNTECYRVVGLVERPEGFVVGRCIRNFRIVKEGDVIGRNGRAKVNADHDFYPILFGKNTYKTIFGFMGEKIDIFSEIR